MPRGKSSAQTCPSVLGRVGLFSCSPALHRQCHSGGEFLASQWGDQLAGRAKEEVSLAVKHPPRPLRDRCCARLEAGGVGVVRKHSYLERCVAWRIGWLVAPKPLCKYTQNLREPPHPAAPRPLGQLCDSIAAEERTNWPALSEAPTGSTNAEHEEARDEDAFTSYSGRTGIRT